MYCSMRCVEPVDGVCYSCVASCRGGFWAAPWPDLTMTIRDCVTCDREEYTDI